MTQASSRAPLRIIGVDVATQPKSVGLALAALDDGRLQLERVTALPTWDAIDAQVLEWLVEPTLLAIDAPLGWPEPLGHLLREHRAGAPLDAEANRLFRRETDDVVARALRKRPLDVGADRIARTAHSALAMLARIRKATDLEIPLPTEPGGIASTCAIEVYPAGTLASRSLLSSGYKGAGADAVAARHTILSGIASDIVLPPAVVKSMAASDHVLDAALCCLAAADFVRRDVILPDSVERARREGWIWVAPPR